MSLPGRALRKKKAAARAAFFSSLCRLLAGMLLAVRTLERGAGRAGKLVVGGVGLPVPAAIAVAIVVVAVVEGSEGGSGYRARGRHGAAHDIARHLTGACCRPPARQGCVGVRDPLAADRVTLNLLAFGERLRSLGLCLRVLRTLGHCTLSLCTLGHRWARQHGDDNGRSAEDGNTCSVQSLHWTLPFL